MDKTSVIIATYNGEQYIYEQLASIINQTVKPDEVIITDDNSSDSTRDIVESIIKDNCLYNWKLIINKPENKGVSENFVNGIKNCTGDVVFLCDQDDVWKPNKIQRIVKYFTDANIKCVISSIDYIDENGKKLRINTVFSSKKSHYVDFAELLSVCSYLGMSAAFKADVIKDVDLDFMKSSAHDWALFMSAIEKGKILFAGERLSCYRQHKNNYSTIKDLDKKKKRLRFLSRQISHINAILEHKQLTPNDRQLCKDYIGFLYERINLINSNNWARILLSYVQYKKRKYTNRNFIADLYAAL